MSWLDIAHWMIIGCSATLVLVHGMAWLRLRDSAGPATLAGLAFCLAGLAVVEMNLLAARDAATYARWIWWMHLPVFGLVVCAVMFVRLHLKAGRTWLAWTAVTLRALVLIINLGSSPAINFSEVTAVRTVEYFGASMAVPQVVDGPWFGLVLLSLLAAIAFLTDATIEIWRKRAPGDRSGLPTTVGLAAFAVFGTFVAWGRNLVMPDAPLVLTIVFTPVLLAMALELGLQQMRGIATARELAVAKDELARSEQRLAMAADAAQAGLWEIDPATGRAWSTPRALAQFGLPPAAEHEFALILAHVVEEDRDRVVRSLLAAMETPSLTTVEYRVRLADGSTRWFVSSGSPMITGTPPRRVLTGATLDVTERKLAELEMVRAKEAAEAASRAKSAFLANMSHELRTPLHAILGHAQMLRDEHATPEQKAGLTTIETASRHLLGLIEDVLDLARIEAVGGVRLNTQDFSLAELLEEMRNLVASVATEKGLAFAVDASGAPQWLHGDTQRLRQALLNYVGNALKFTASGSVTVRCEPVSQAGDEVLLRFSVTDTGIGVDPAVLPRLFTPFEQVDASSTRARGGSGLGLAITKRLAQAMGGEAGASSRLGAGSTFWFTARLHLASRPGAATERPAGDEALTALRQRHAGARVLLAEDNAVSRRLAQRMLGGAGLEVHAAADGAQALAQARERRHDLILMDLSMPVLDGLAAARAIRKLPGHAGVPVVAVTGNAFEEDRRACEAAGMTDFVTKPIDWPALWPRLLHWLDDARGSSGETGAA